METIKKYLPTRFRTIFVFLALFLWICLILVPILNSCNTANNDLFLQLLSADGILTGKGYGYEDNGEFNRIADRAPGTRYPPGVTMLAALVKALGGDPLVVLVGLFPVLISIAFLALYDSLLLRNNHFFAILLAFSALTPFCIFQYYLWLGSEPIALPVAALIFAIASKDQEIERSGYWRPLMKIIPLIWILCMIRSAMLFFAAGILISFTLLNVRTILKKLTMLCLLGIISVLPQLLFIFLMNGNNGNLGNNKNFPSAFIIVDELKANVGVLTEAVAFRSYRLAKAETLVFVIGVCLIAASGFVCWKLSRKYAATNGMTFPQSAVTSALIICLIYLGGLSMYAWIAKFGWSGVYRVQGFILPWAVIAFWGSLINFLPSNKLKATALAGSIFVAFLRLAGGHFLVTHQIESEPLYRDYRQVEKEIQTAISGSFNETESLSIYTGGHYWNGRNVHRLLLYFNKNCHTLPWKIRSINTIEDHFPMQAHSVLLISKSDVHMFPKLLATGKMIKLETCYLAGN